MSTTTDTPRIYVASLSDYNAGTLHGEWVDAIDEDEIWEAIHRMLASSKQPGAEEWAIHDYEGFGGIRINEGEDIAKVAELGASIKAHGEAFAAYVGYVGTSYATAKDFEEAYRGEYLSEEDYAEEIFDEFNVPEPISQYIDYKKFARDLFCGDYFSVDGSEGIFVFSRF